MADWWNGIHRRLKISRPFGLASSSLASATIRFILRRVNMGSIIRYLVIGTGIYFGINWIADHPYHVKVIRKHMNRMVDNGLDAIKEAVHDGASEVATQTQK
tara:strand:+ start:135 stop:440 length:306 start_codon:yes stop_codon:yes gene_type:complete